MRRYCILCEQHPDAWHPYIIRERDISEFLVRLGVNGSNVERFQCPHCWSTDRDRHLRLFFDRLHVLDSVKGGELLHIASEAALVKFFNTLSPRRYVLGDLHPQGPDTLKVDLENMQFPDVSFDMIIFNHVLEHVEDHRRALREAFRVLRPGGRLICQTPFAARLTSTFEDAKLQSAADRLYFYGQDDHARLFGTDIENMIQQAGFSGNLVWHDDVLSDIDPEQYGVNEREPFFNFVRAGPVGKA